MPSPGTYRPDASEGIDSVTGLPPPHRKQRQRNRQHAPCPSCGQRCPLHRTVNFGPSQLGDALNRNERIARIEVHQTDSLRVASHHADIPHGNTWCLPAWCNALKCERRRNHSSHFQNVYKFLCAIRLVISIIVPVGFETLIIRCG